MCKAQPVGKWHDARNSLDVSLGRITVIVWLLVAPSTASAQPWADAYRAGDYQKAAKLLQAVVLDTEHITESASPTPARYLARLYAQGRGVNRDPILACTLATLADSASQNEAPRFGNNVAAWDAHVKASERFLHDHCDGLSSADLLTASRLLGCFAFGLVDQVLMLGEQPVRVGKGGVRIADSPGQDGWDPEFGCQVVARVRPLTILPPPDAAPGVRARHFLEVLSWHLGTIDGQSRRSYVLQWQLFEAHGAGIGGVASEAVYAAGTWPEPIPDLPSSFDARVTIEMIRSGHIRWRADGAPPKRGWLMLPEDNAR